MDLKEKSILFAVPVLTGGGAERVVTVLASGMAEKGIKTSILVNRRCENEYPVSDKVNIVSLPERYGKSGNLIHKLKKTYARYIIMKELKPDIVLGFLHGVLEPSFICCKILNIKFVSTIRVNPAVSENENLKLRNLIIKYSDACFVQNEEQKQYFPKKIQKKIFAVANPVSEKFINCDKEYSSDLRVITTVGRLKQQKNQKLLIKAMSILVNKHPNLILNIYGEGPEREALQKYIEDLKLEKHVFLLGRNENMVHVYKESDLFVLSSDFEGMPNALMEAMAVGLPCISTNCPTGPRDLINSDSNGILISVGNLEALVDSIDRLSNDYCHAIGLGINAKKTIINNYRTSNICETLYKKLSRYM